jgi:hypothetical protein
MAGQPRGPIPIDDALPIGRQMVVWVFNFFDELRRTAPVAKP